MAWLLTAVVAVLAMSLVVGFVVAHIGVLVVTGASYFAWNYFRTHRRG